jgi:predicted N-acetyltransferase YhbS
MSDLPNVEIRIEDDVDGMVSDEIERRLIDALRQNVPSNDSEPLTVIARGDGATVIGGLVGSTSYGWLLVKMLWVEERMQGHGVGTRLMADAEEVARARGCHAVWLDTSSARAEEFYAKLGFTRFGILENSPGESPQGHRRVFLAKRLSLPNRPRRVTKALLR